MNYDPLKLENQLCFPIYAASKEIIRRYRPLLDELNITYTQYIAMMVLWENSCMSVKQLGERLMLDSGTLTPVLKSLEEKGYIRRTRSEVDERVLNVTLTDDGVSLKEKAMDIPKKMAGCVCLTQDEATTLYTLLYKVLDNLK